MRSLSSDEYYEAEEIKTKIFLSLEPFKNIKEENVLSKLNTIDSIEGKDRIKSYNSFVKLINNDMPRQMTTDEIKYTKAYFYTNVVY